MPLAESHHVVVDGSNLATEGRTLPSLAQLDEAVRAFAAEDRDASIIVVVDATFEHRVTQAERDEVREAMLNGELVSPPAGAIGRGDAFVLRIAERTGAIVLSNDSFQEFHGEHPWLFHDGRLIGGKPVPGVGWIFTPRVPIRGPKSRAATAEAESAKDPESAPAKAAELARAAKKAAKKAAKATKKAAKRAAPPVDTSWPMTPAVPPPARVKVDPVFSSAVEEAVEEALHPPEPKKAKGEAKKLAPAKKGAPQKSTKVKKDAGAKHDGHAAKRPKTPKAPKTTKEAKAAEASPSRNRRSKKRSSTPPPAVNEPLSFIHFVASFTVGSTIFGEVVSFTSHGAMVDVSLPGGGVLHCYIPLTAMGTPPPNKARQVLTKGETRPFVLAGLDPPRRVAELALPKPALSRESAADEAAKKKPTKSAAAPQAKAAATSKKAPKRTTKATTKKVAVAKKAPATKARPAKKPTPTKKTTPTKKSAPTKKTVVPTKKAASTKKAVPSKKTTTAKKTTGAKKTKPTAR